MFPFNDIKILFLNSNSFFTYKRGRQVLQRQSGLSGSVAEGVISNLADSRGSSVCTMHAGQLCVKKMTQQETFQVFCM